MKREIAHRILGMPSYWKADIENKVYDIIIRKYQETNIKVAARHFGISRRKVRRILKGKEVTLTVDDIIKISVKSDLCPVLKLTEKDDYIKNMQMGL